jgi:hypothetical protein
MGPVGSGSPCCAPDEPELDLPPRAVGLVAIAVNHVVVIAAVLVLVVSVDDATV